jgi:UDP-4-amino-4-deoxy-L-arabinose-oxoglutarate aminotransferase
VSRVEFYRHSVGEAEREAVDQTLAELFLTTGQRVSALEAELGAFLGGGVSVLGTSSCTASMHLALLACGVRPGDEVIVTPMTFIATANAILHAGATPIFADVDPVTANLDPALVEAAITPRTRAVLCVHLYGQMADVHALRPICDRHGLALIEDAAHALEAKVGEVRPGQVGDAACFSFYATKNITSGEGGALAMRDPERLARARCLSLHGMSAGAADRYQGTYRHWDMIELGFKYNMTNIQAAMLSPQLGRVEALRAERERLARRYEAALTDVPGLDFPRVASTHTSARHLFTLWVPADRRDHYLAELGRREIGVAVNYRAVHLLSYYQARFGYAPGALPVAEAIGQKTISLPLYPSLTAGDQDRVIAEILAVHRMLR